MQEHSSPATFEIPATAALPDAVTEHAATSPDRAAFSRNVGGTWVPVTSREFAEQVAALARGMIAAGVGAGDRVGILSRTRYEWTLADYAVWTAGGVAVPIYETSSAEQAQWILSDSGAVAVVVETADHRSMVESVREGLPGLREVWQIDAGDLDTVAARAAEVPEGVLAERRATLSADTLATIIYTSGTTGRPKGCELTHGNLMYVAELAPQVIPAMAAENASSLLFLPLAHVFARIIEVGCVENGARLGHTADLTELLADLGTFQPSFLVAVPRVFEKVYNGARQKAHAGGKGAIFDRAERVAVAWSKAQDTGGAGLGLNLQHKLFDALVYGKLRAAMGGKVEYALSGGAPLGERLGHFFRGIGVTILEGYGLTETTGPSTVSGPDAMKVGTVGRPAPGSAVRISEHGEIQVRGPQVFRGYWNNPDATAETMRDGWFATGDLGVIDDEGYVTITGRMKEIIVTSGGKNVSPAVLEDKIRAHPLVSQCIVVGDNRPFIGCLVTLDAEALPGWLETKGRPTDTPLAQLVDDPEVLAEIQAAVDRANTQVSKAEAIKSFAVLPVEWTVEGGQLTPSLKLKRSVVMKEFAGEVEKIYA
ncbi:AMP-dependent synthetase/ligase [Blastococcus sp. VKM Ac-2987]|uniref:AMP-dependent synthetase/ligase n=1 Tax=Blastococcus sp. VKM Ac-2987 TaxID=3004141 RepID=UPI0022ABA68B|nr:AMP-dependent synthetase/ligase [Blastococcus sp. VKM Ac-2987]MCZ2857623.1 AMP-dependent synthetase/ligase [Blastococcus sp. VKM Ac-2987]